MKEPMTDARRKQLYRIKKRKRRKQCIRVALRMAVLCFLVLFAVQKTADLLRVDDSDRMEDAEQSYSGQGGKTRTNTEKTWGVFGKADVLTQEDKLHSIEESDEYPDQLKELAEKNSETIDFVYDYPEMKDKKQTIDLSQEAKTDTVPLLLHKFGHIKELSLPVCSKITLKLPDDYRNDTGYDVVMVNPAAFPLLKIWKAVSMNTAPPQRA